MEAFLVSFTPVSAITILSAMYKRVESGVWTDDREKEIDIFVKVLNKTLNTIRSDDKERLEKLDSFGNGEILRQRVSCYN